MDTFHVYLPADRVQALARGETLPDRTQGTALFADISGFTPLTEALARDLGPRRGAEEVTRQLNRVYDALIAPLHRCGGVVIGFSGDGITCWIEEKTEGRRQKAEERGEKREDSPFSLLPSPVRAIACALAMQAAMQAFAAVPLPSGETVALMLKVAIATGPARRFVVGDPEIQLLDVVAGETLARVAAAEHLAQPGDVILDTATFSHVEEQVKAEAWRTDEASNEQFAVISDRYSLFSGQSALLSQVRPLATDNWPLPTDLRPWLLPVVYERLRAGLDDFLTELRPAVALFLRFSGIDYDGDEAAGAKLDDFVSRVQGIMTPYEGVLLQLTIGEKGSYLYAALGVMVAHEDDAQRAARAALALQRLPAELPFLDPVQMGLSQGTLRVGSYGGTKRRTYGALGDDVNLAVRLMQTAAPGEVLISGRVQAALGKRYMVEPRPPLPLKGKAESLPVFALTGPARRRAIRLEEPTYVLPMIGRERELALIAAKMELALRGQGQVVGITAEAGMGKSRLVAEAIRLARRQGFVGYGGACHSYGTNSRYLAWKPVWQAFFDVDPVMPLRKQVRLIAGELEDRAPERLPALPLLGPLLDLPLEENDFTSLLKPKDRKNVLETVLLECLSAAAREAGEEGSGLLFVLEDIHWLDPLSHDLLEQVARAGAKWPLLLLLAYRPPELARLQRPRVESLPHFTKITLNELGAAELADLIRAKLAQRFPERTGPLPDELVDQLTARAQGNPFYVEELLNYLHDRGVNPYSPAVLAALEWPASLHTLILSRIDQLSEREKTTLKVASIIGRLFQFAWLHGYYPALGDGAQVKADLVELERLDITPLDTPEPELTYLFKHLVTQEVTYKSLPYATRARLHEQLARWLEASLPETPPLDLLVYHYDRSPNVVKKRDYLRRAAEAAQAAFANEAALDYYGRLLPLLNETGEQIDVRLKLGTVLQLVGRWHEAEAHYHEALALSEKAAEAAAMARCQQALAVLAKERGDLSVALDWLERARAGWEALANQTELGQTLAEMGVVFWRRGDYADATRHLEMGLAIARQMDDRRGVARALHSLGVVAQAQGNDTAARALHEESLALKRELGDKLGIAASLNSLGIVVHNQGDTMAARALYEQSLALKRELGDKLGIGKTVHNLGNIAYDQGDYATARMMYEQSLALELEMGHKPGIASSYGTLGLLACTQSDYATAREMYEKCLALAWEMGDKGEVVYALAGLAAAAVGMGRTRRAARLAAAAETQRATLNQAFEVDERRLFDRTVASVQAALDKSTLATAWAEGEQITLAEAVAYALQPEA